MPVTEEDVAFPVLAIAAQNPNGIASFDQIRDEGHLYLALDSADLAQSITRPNEPMWHQKIRNIQSHYQSPGNFIQCLRGIEWVIFRGDCRTSLCST